MPETGNTSLDAIDTVLKIKASVLVNGFIKSSLLAITVLYRRLQAVQTSLNDRVKKVLIGSIYFQCSELMLHMKGGTITRCYSLL